MANDVIVGTTTAFGGDVPVGGVIVDQQAALLAEACFDPGMAKCTFGTGAFLLANTGTTPVHSTAGLTSSVAWRVADTDTFCVDGQVYTAASAVRWLCSLGIISGAEEMDGVAAARHRRRAVRARTGRSGRSLVAVAGHRIGVGHDAVHRPRTLRAGRAAGDRRADRRTGHRHPAPTPTRR